MNIRLACIDDLDTILVYDKHVQREELHNLVELNRVFIAEDREKFCGWLRYNLFWDQIPFMNMLYLLEYSRGKSYGRKLVEYWETEMKKLSYQLVMTSTASDEYAQHFYIKLGYKMIGGFLLEDDPYEIILSKNL